jgi:hypothetical protein
MNNTAVQLTPHERREHVDINEHHDNLSPDQVEKIYSLSKVGYSLYFVRKVEGDKRLAVVRAGKDIASVDHNGNINYEPSVILRTNES